MDNNHPLGGMKPGLKEAAAFVELLTGETNPSICFQTFCDREKRDDLASTWHGTLQGSVKRLARAQAKRCGVYVTVNETDGTGRKAKNIRAIRAAFVDFDGAPLPKKWKIAPHILNETSSGRYHAFWLLNQSEDFEAWRSLQAQLAAHFGGDPKMTDLPRVVRLPGFFHLKTKPFRSRIINAIEPGEVPLDGFSRLSMAELAEAYPAEFDVPLAPRDGERVEEPEGGFDNEADVARAIHYLKEDAPLSVEGEHGDNTAFEVAAQLRDFGISRDLALELMAEHWNDRCSPPWSDDELALKVRNAFRYAQNNAGERSLASAFADDLPAVKTAKRVSILSQGLALNGRSSEAKDTIANAYIAVHRSGILPAFDEFRRKVIFQADKLPWHESYGRELTDETLRMFRFYLVERYQGNAYTPSKENVFEAVKTIAFGNKFDPVVEYLADAQAKWDGKPRIENLFGTYFKCGESDYVRGVSRAFMVGAARRPRKPGSKFDTMPILRSAQGWNKSTAIKTLFGADFFSDSNLGDLRGKDAALLIRGVWGLEFPELEGMNRADSNTLKAFMSRAVDSVRDPYDRVVSSVPRRGVFIGTANEGGFLKDMTGGRRFWPLTLQAPVNVDAIIADRDQLWGEAAALEARGESDMLPEVLWKVAAKHQLAETAGDPWLDELRAFLEERAANYAFGEQHSEGASWPPADRVHTRELLETLGIKADRQTIGLAQRLRVVMESGAMNWRYKASLRVRGRVGPGYVSPDFVDRKRV